MNVLGKLHKQRFIRNQILEVALFNMTINDPALYTSRPFYSFTLLSRVFSLENVQWD